jgi:uncharacterized membrane protein YccC
MVQASVLSSEVRKCFEVAAVRPAFALGLRAATATIIPLVIGVAVDQPLFGWMSLAGWLCAIADPGGSSLLRAQAMVTFAVAAALATGVGTAVSTRSAFSIGVLFAGAVAAPIAAMGGKAAGSVGTLALVLLCVAVGWPAHAELVAPRVAMVLGGCLISVALALSSWPLQAVRRARPSRPGNPKQADARRPAAPATPAADPIVLRHAVRMAATVSVAAASAAWIGIAPAFWVTASVVIVLQPESAATIHRAFHYLLGTVLGAGVAALLMPALRSPTLIGILLFPLSALALALRPLNYGLFILLVTPVYLLMAAVLSGNPHLASARVLSVFIGCGLAFAAQLVWPGQKVLTKSSPP